MWHKPWTLHLFQWSIHICWWNKPQPLQLIVWKCAQLVAAILLHQRLTREWGRKSRPRSRSLSVFLSVFVVVLVSFPSVSKFNLLCVQVSLFSHSGLVTMKLNNTIDVRAVFVCRESELTWNERCPPPHQPEGLLFLLSFPLHTEENWFRAMVKQLF